jgi:hypothetical protein
MQLRRLTRVAAFPRLAVVRARVYIQFIPCLHATCCDFQATSMG